MDLSSWNENIEMVESIINEIIQDAKIESESHQRVFFEFDKLKQYYKINRLDYKNYDEINKEILSNINQYIQDEKSKKARNSIQTMITPIGQNQGQMKYSKTEEVNRRKVQFEEKLKNVTEDFNKHMEKPKSIDFSDKTEMPNQNLDNLMEIEMQKRRQDYTTISDTDIKNAEQWITNSGSGQNIIKTPQIENDMKLQIQNTNTFEYDMNQSNMNQSNMKNVIEKDKLKSILKKVSFKDNIQQKNSKVDSLLQKLQDDRNLLMPLEVPEINENKIYKTSLKPGKPILNQPILNQPNFYNENTQNNETNLLYKDTSQEKNTPKYNYQNILINK